MLNQTAPVADRGYGRCLVKQIKISRSARQLK